MSNTVKLLFLAGLAIVVALGSYLVWPHGANQPLANAPTEAVEQPEVQPQGAAEPEPAPEPATQSAADTATDTTTEPAQPPQSEQPERNKLDKAADATVSAVQKGGKAVGTTAKKAGKSVKKGLENTGKAIDGTFRKLFNSDQ